MENGQGPTALPQRLTVISLIARGGNPTALDDSRSPLLPPPPLPGLRRRWLGLPTRCSPLGPNRHLPWKERRTPSKTPSGAYLLLLLPCQLHLLLLLLEEHGSHVLLLRVGCQELVPQGGQLMDHDQKLELLLCQALLRPCSIVKQPELRTFVCSSV